MQIFARLSCGVVTVPCVLRKACMDNKSHILGNRLCAGHDRKLTGFPVIRIAGVFFEIRPRKYFESPRRSYHVADACVRIKPIFIKGIEDFRVGGLIGVSPRSYTGHSIQIPELTHLSHVCQDD